MKLKEIVKVIEKIAMEQPAVRKVVPNDIYMLNNLNDAEFAVFGWTQEPHTEDIVGGFITYNFVFFYVDRLAHDDVNRLDVQSTGIAVLSNIIKRMQDEGCQPAGDVTYTTFNQRFAQDCAGTMVRVGFLVNSESLCSETNKTE